MKITKIMNLISLQDYEIEAKKVLDKKYFEYFRGGAGDELTLSLNTKSYDR